MIISLSLIEGYLSIYDYLSIHCLPLSVGLSFSLFFSFSLSLSSSMIVFIYIYILLYLYLITLLSLLFYLISRNLCIEEGNPSPNLGCTRKRSSRTTTSKRSNRSNRNRRRRGTRERRKPRSKPSDYYLFFSRYRLKLKIKE